MNILELFKPKWQHSDPFIREEGVRKLKDQELLTSIFENDDDQDIRQIALMKLENKRYVINVAENKEEDVDIRATAVEKILDQDFIRRILINKDEEWELRRAAITNNQDKDLLKEIALNDLCDITREEAVEYLTDISSLESIALNDKNGGIRCIAIRKITNKSILEKIALNDWHSEARKMAIDKIENQKVIENAAINDNESENRLFAMQKINNAKSLLKIYNKEPDQIIRLAILSFLEKKFNVNPRDSNQIAKIFLESKDNDLLKSTDTLTFAELKNILLYSQSLDEKISAICTLVKLNTDEALVEVMETLKDPDGEMTLHASIALSTFGDITIPHIINAFGSWEMGYHQERNIPLNLKERLLYPLALLGKKGCEVLLTKIKDEDKIVRTSAEDLLKVIKNPLSFSDNKISTSQMSNSFGWELPSHLEFSNDIYLGKGEINPRTLSIISILCSHQGLFSTGLLGQMSLTDLYDLSKENITINIK